MTKKRLFIDCDSLIYAAGFATEHLRYTLSLGEDFEISFPSKKELNAYLKENSIENPNVVSQKEIEPLSHALWVFKQALEKLFTKFEDYEPKIFITSTDNSNFRYKIAKTVPYKGTRYSCIVCDKRCKALFTEDGQTEVRCNNKECEFFEKATKYQSVKPFHYSAIRQHLQEEYADKVLEAFNMEADDAISIYCTEYQDDEIVVVSIDKDLWQIEGPKFYNQQKEEFEDLDCGEEQLKLSEDRRKLYGVGEKWIYAQMLLGDNADNITGMPKYGPVKVYETLKDLSARSCRDKVKSIYKDDSRFEENLKLLSMLKTGKEDYYIEVLDAKKKEVV